MLRELLATTDMDANDPIYLQCVTALYNMAQCSGKINEKLVRVPALESVVHHSPVLSSPTYPS